MRPFLHGFLMLLLVLVYGAEPVLGGQPKPPRRIAVLPLTNLRPGAETDWIGEGAAESLTTKLAGVTGLTTVERLQIKKVIEEQDFRTALTDEQARKVGRLIGADRLVLGSFVKSGSDIMFNARVVDVETGVVLSTASVQAAESKVFDALFQLADAVIASFDKKVVLVDNRPVAAEALPAERVVLTEEERRKLKDWGTTSPEAYEAYSKGVAATDPAEEIRLDTTAIFLDQGYAWAYNNRGCAYGKKGETDRAIQDFDKAIELNPSFALAYTNRGTAYNRRREHDRAIRDHDKAMELDPFCTAAYINRGTAYDDKGQYDQAIRDFDIAIVFNPSYAQAYYNRGNAYYRQREYDRAIRDYDKAIELNPSFALAYGNRGVAYCDKREYDRAIVDHDKVIELNPSLAQAYDNRGIVYKWKGEYDRAIRDHDKAIELNPSYAEAYYNRGIAYYMKGEHDRAIRDFDRAIELRPSYAEAYDSRGATYGAKGDYGRAIRDSEKAIEQNPAYAQAYYNRGVAYFCMKAYDKAWEDVKKCQAVGGKVNPMFLEALRKASGRNE